jgi:hypothetical protein
LDEVAPVSKSLIIKSVMYKVRAENKMKRDFKRNSLGIEAGETEIQNDSKEVQ